MQKVKIVKSVSSNEIMAIGMNGTTWKSSLGSDLRPLLLWLHPTVSKSYPKSAQYQLPILAEGAACNRIGVACERPNESAVGDLPQAQRLVL